MSNITQLVSGFVLMLASLGLLMLCVPRHGKKAWFVGLPLIETGVSVVVVTGFVLGLLFIAAYFTAIDDATLAGAAKHSWLPALASFSS